MAKEIRKVQTRYPDTIEYEIYTDGNTTAQVNINNEFINQGLESPFEVNVPGSPPQSPVKKRRRTLADECFVHPNMNHSRLRNVSHQEYGSPSLQTKQRRMISRSSFNNRGQNIANYNSYLCEAVNTEGEQVAINDNLVKDRLILSCRPREHPQSERTFSKSPGVQRREISPRYETGQDSRDVHDKRNLIFGEMGKSYPHKVLDKSTSVRSDYFHKADNQMKSFTDKNINLTAANKPILSNALSDAQRYNEQSGFINNELNNEFALSNHSRSYYGQRIVEEPREIEVELNNHRYDTFQEIGLSESLKMKNERQIEYHESLYKRDILYPYADKSTLVRSDYFGPECPRSPPHGIPKEELKQIVLKKTDQPSHRPKVDEKYLTKCKTKTRNFIDFLWCLHFINIFIFVLALILLVYTSHHFLKKQYFNIVIENTGFVSWLWAVLVVSIFIILLAISGIIISVYHSRLKLVTYCILVTVMAIIILILIVSIWIGFDDVKSNQNFSMDRTRQRYRCVSEIKFAWDSLQETQHCCGVVNQTEWKYLPRSCCHIISSSEEIVLDNRCFMQNKLHGQAYQRGCRKVLEDYFTNMFRIITGLLFLVLVFLLLGLVAAVYLLINYKEVGKCQEILKVPS